MFLTVFLANIGLAWIISKIIEEFHKENKTPKLLYRNKYVTDEEIEAHFEEIKKIKNKKKRW